MPRLREKSLLAGVAPLRAAQIKSRNGIQRPIDVKRADGLDGCVCRLARLGGPLAHASDRPYPASQLPGGRAVRDDRPLPSPVEGLPPLDEANVSLVGVVLYAQGNAFAGFPGGMGVREVP